MKKFLIPMLLMTSTAFAANQTPTSVQMKIFGVWVAQNADCSNPVKVCDGSASLVDLKTNPTLCGGDIPDATYNCVILRVGDTLSIGYAGGSCQLDIFTAANYYSGQNGDAIDDATNSPSLVPANSEQTVYLYLSRNADPDAAIFNKPTTSVPGHSSGTYAGQGGEYLASPFVVNGNSAGTFKVKNLTSVDDSNCGLNASGPIWHFE